MAKDNKTKRKADSSAVSSRARTHTHAHTRTGAGVPTGADTKGKPARYTKTVKGKRPSAGKAKPRAMRTVEMKKVSAAPSIMKRPKPRRRPLQVTSQFGAVTPRAPRREKGVAAIRKKTMDHVQTIRVHSASLPWATILTAAVCTLVIMAMVFNYVRLNELTNKYRSLQDQTVQLLSDRKRLTLALEQKNDLIAFEETARKAGMVKSDRVEKRYIRLDTEDKIIVPVAEANPIVRFVQDAWSSLTGAIKNIFVEE